MKKTIPGLFGAIIKGVPLVVDLVKPLIRKKPLSDNELQSKHPAELITLIKQYQSADDETLIMYITKRVLTAATVYFVIWSAKQMGVTYNDVISLFGLIK